MKQLTTLLDEGGEERLVVEHDDQGHVWLTMEDTTDRRLEDRCAYFAPETARSLRDALNAWLETFDE